MSATSRAGRAMAGGSTAPAAPHCLAPHAGGAARADPPGGSRSWQSVRSPRDCSGLSSRAWNVRATLESREGPKVLAALEQMGRKAMAERMQRDRLAQRRGFGGLLEQATQLTRGQRLSTATWKQPARFRRAGGVTRGRPRLPPLPQQLEDV